MGKLSMITVQCSCLYKEELINAAVIHGLGLRMVLQWKSFGFSSKSLTNCVIYHC
jgi:hypothetical protein